MKTVTLPGGEAVPALGLGTWCMGENPALRKQEIATIRLALERGASLIDTAEMYGDGRSESLIGEALSGRRDQAFLVSKVYPHHSGRKQMQAACERSLRRLGTDRIDLYLLHWRGSIPLAEVVEGFLALREAGKIRHFGVSNLDHADMLDWWRIPEARVSVTNQVLYNLGRRGIEWNLLPWCRQQGLPVMAYSPVEQGRLLAHPGLRRFALSAGMSPSTVALSWLLSREGIIAIPKTSHPERLEENLRALEVRLSAEQQAELDTLFPPPRGPAPLEVL